MTVDRALPLALVGAVLASLLFTGPAQAAACAPADHAGGEWTMMNHDLSNTRHQPLEKTLGPLQAATLEPAWTFDANANTGTANNEITGYPIAADGCIFVGSSTGNQAPGWAFALNADTGKLVWKTPIEYGIYSTAAVADGRVYFFVSRVGDELSDETRGPTDDCGIPDHKAGDPEAEVTCGPYVVALDQATGDVLWETTVDYQEGSDAVSSPVVFDGMLWVGVSGTAAEGEEEDRFDFRGASVLLDAETGELLDHTWTISNEELEEGYAGGALWATVAYDPATKQGFAGTGNPFNYDKEHHQTNAILKFDFDPDSATFGEVTGSYKGDVEEYFPQVAENFSCDEDDPIGFFLAGFECGRLDVDFGASVQIFEIDGETVIGEGQKSGVYHVVDPDSMDHDPATNDAVWKQVVGVPSLVGGIVGTPAFDGDSIITPHTLAGYLMSLDSDTGAHEWAAPVGDAVHWGNPVTSANGIVYTVDLKGFLDAYDAATGLPLLHRPLGLGAGTGTDPTLTWGGTTVARNTVYATVGVGLTSAGADFPSMPNGFVLAFRPAL